jgi:nucleotide-binding universal stress UspA family protein
MLRRMTGSDRPVLIAYDGSLAARQAVANAAEILRSCRIVVVTVWEAGLAYATPAMPPDGMSMNPTIDPAVALSVDRNIHRQAERIAGDGAALAKSLGFDAEPLAVPDDGNIAETILNVARSRNVAAIVVGSRGLSGLRARLEGSTSKGLLKHAHVPVIVVHETEDEVRPD